MDFNKHCPPHWLSELSDTYLEWCNQTLPAGWNDGDNNAYSNESGFLISLNHLIGYGWDGEVDTIIEFVDECNEILSDTEKNTPFYKQVDTIRNTILTRLAGDIE